MKPQLVPYLLYEPEESGILWIKFNRPERMNAIVGSAEPNGTVAKVVEYMQAGDDDPNIRVIVLTGVGRGFCSGADLRGAPEGFQREESSEPPGPDSSRQRFFHKFTKLFREISLIRKPTIAMVNGPAMGAGMDISLHCDLRVGSENARFFTYQNVGQIIENGALYYLPRIAGLGRALELAYTGGFLEAQRAYEWGVLNRLVPAEKLEEETRTLCDRIIKSPPLVQWINKRIMRAGLDSSLETVMVMTSNAAGILGASEDSREARQAFLERRTPSFKGR